MLNSEQIIKLLGDDADSKRQLSIVPCPDLEGIRSRGGTSIDLRLGRWFKSFKPTRHAAIDISPKGEMAAPPTTWSREYFVRFGNHFTLHPGKFVLGTTLEWMTLPPSLAGHISGKSSLGRYGLIIETASGIHPGFNGCLTLEMANVGEVPLQISPGMPICQIFFFCVNPEHKHNSGNLSGSRKPVIPELRADRILNKLTKQ